MSTYVYGDRDFRGNMISNASLPTYATKTLLDAVTPAQPLKSGHQAWVTSDKKPYWWDPTANGGAGGWITASESGASYYGVITGGTGAAAEINCAVTPPTKVRDRYDGDSVITIPILDAATLSAYPEISTAHPLTVEMEILTGFTIADGPANDPLNPVDEVYNRYGPVIMRTILTTDLDDLGFVTTNPGFAGVWWGGWIQPQGTDTLLGKFGPSWTTVAKTVETPTMYGKDSAAGYGIEAVDIHAMTVVASGATPYFEVAGLSSGTYTNLVTWQLEYSAANGLRFIATSNAAAYSYVMLAYDDDWAACADPFPGFDGRAKGFVTRYWF